MPHEETANDTETEEQRLMKIKENLMKRLNSYDFKDDGNLNDLEYDEYEDVEEEEEEKQEPEEQEPQEQEPDEEEYELKQDITRVDELFESSYNHHEEEESEASENDLLDDDNLKRKNKKITRNEISKLKEEKQMVKEIIASINEVLDDFKFTMNNGIQNANILKRKNKFDEKEKEKLIEFHNNERAQAEDDINFLIDEMPGEFDLEDRHYDKIDNTFEKVLKKVEKIL